MGTFHVGCAYKAQGPVIETTQALSGAGVAKVVALPGPCILEGWLTFERNDRSIVVPYLWLGDNIHDPTQRTGSQLLAGYLDSYDNKNKSEVQDA